MKTSLICIFVPYFPFYNHFFAETFVLKLENLISVIQKLPSNIVVSTVCRLWFVTTPAGPGSLTWMTLFFIRITKINKLKKLRTSTLKLKYKIL